MSYYTLLYIFASVLSIYGGYAVYRMKRDLSGLMFLYFTIFASLWFLTYYLFFTDILSASDRLLVSRFCFSVGVVAVYSFLAYIYYYPSSRVSTSTREYLALHVFFLLVVSTYTYSSGIIESLSYDPTLFVYIEVFGRFFFLHIAFHSIFLIFLPGVFYRSIRSLSDLDKIRLKNILLSTLFLISSLLIFQLLLPYFGIYILEKEIIYFFMLFIVSINFIMRRYYFSDFGYSLSHILGVVGAFFLSYVIVIGAKEFFKNMNPGRLGYWQIIDDYPLLEMVTVFLGFLSFFSLGKRWIVPEIENRERLSLKIEKIKQYISATTSIDELRSVLSREMRHIFSATHADIFLIDISQGGFLGDFQKFFSRQKRNKIFINDIVFLDRYKTTLQGLSYLKNLSKDMFLIFPLYDRGDTYRGIWSLGKKRFGDFYTESDIQILRDFTFFLSTHLRYLDTYHVMRDLSDHLDRRVDEKTIEYNNLINRQKEFISLVSHEVRSPLSSLLFQADSLISDIEKGVRIERKTLHAELETLRAQLMRTSSLVAKMFAVEYHDTHQVSLFREKIHFPQFLAYELDLFRAVHPEVQLSTSIDENVGFVEIDKVQFQQVLSNLLDNALKFSEKESPVISCELKKKRKKIILSIEDNGIGLGDVHRGKIFDKYMTGKQKNIGLGMGLYLCQKIVMMHGGTIEASESERYGGARFAITLDSSHVGISGS